MVPGVGQLISVRNQGGKQRKTTLKRRRDQGRREDTNLRLQQIIKPLPSHTAPYGSAHGTIGNDDPKMRRVNCKGLGDIPIHAVGGHFSLHGKPEHPQLREEVDGPPAVRKLNWVFALHECGASAKHSLDWCDEDFVVRESTPHIFTPSLQGCCNPSTS
jgi:hypothetical protein